MMPRWVAGLLLVAMSGGCKRVEALLSQHPGEIEWVETDADGTRTEVKSVAADEPPKRFYFVDEKGRLTDDEANAKERIPVVRIEAWFYTDDWRPAKKAESRLIEIREYGPGRRRLKSTILTKD